MDPYKVLGVTPETSDDDVKRAYRELARKYHPDNYVGSPLADLAEERMKEINEAYDIIMSGRTGGQAGTDSTASAGGPHAQYTGRQYQSNSGTYSQVRAAINAGNLSLAEELLQRSSTRDAEWHFLMGTVYYRKGWYDEARRCYTQACSMAPTNAEYRNALNMLNMGAGYGGYRPMSSANICDCCTTLVCLNCCCNACGGGGC